MSTVELIGGIIAISLLIAVFYGVRVVMILVLIGAVGYYVINHWSDSTSLTSLPKILGMALIAILALKALAIFFGGIVPLLLTIGLVTVTGAWLYQADNKAGGGWTEVVRNKTQELQTQLPTVDDLKDKIKTVASNCTVGLRTYARSATVDMTDAAPTTVLCDGLPTQACLNGCVYQVSTSNCDSENVKGFKDKGRYLAFVETWWVSNGQVCH